MRIEFRGCQDVEIRTCVDRLPNLGCCIPCMVIDTLNVHINLIVYNIILINIYVVYKLQFRTSCDLYNINVQVAIVRREHIYKLQRVQKYTVYVATCTILNSIQLHCFQVVQNNPQVLFCKTQETYICI